MPFEKVVPAPFRNDAPAPEAPTIDELMTVRIARMLDNECFASAGAVSPLGNVAYRLAKATHAPDLFIGTFSCGHVDIAPGTMTLTLLEAMDSSSAVAHCGGDDTYSTYYQPGIVTHEIIGAAQIDARGRTNNLELTKPSGGKLRLPGQGGMSDVANMHRDYVVYVPRHSRAALVESVEMVSSARGVISAEARQAAGYRPGDIWLVTNLCVFRYDEAVGQLVVVETMPGVSRETISAETGFKVIFADDCKPMDDADTSKSSGSCAKRSIRSASAGSNSSAPRSAARCSTKSSRAIYKARCRSFPRRRNRWTTRRCSKSSAANSSPRSSATCSTSSAISTSSCRRGSCRSTRRCASSAGPCRCSRRMCSRRRVRTVGPLSAKPFGLLFEALDDLRENEIYIATGSSLSYALWGGLMSTRAIHLKAAGAVLDGYVRDANEIEALGFTVFCRGTYAQDQAPRGKVIDYRCPIAIDGIAIAPGDLLFGDREGRARHSTRGRGRGGHAGAHKSAHREPGGGLPSATA